MGVSQWADVHKHKVWLAGREIGTAGELRAGSGTLPGTFAGVAAPAGFTPQSGGASPKASTGASDYPTRVLSFQPYVSETDFEHVSGLRLVQQQGLPRLWLPEPRVESWSIRSTARTTWSLAHLISGSTGVRALHVVPKVEIRDASGVVTATTEPTNHPGAATLTIVSGVPAGSDEIQISSTDDVGELVTGDLSGDVGGSLLVRYYGLVTVEIVSVDRETVDFNDLRDEIEYIERPILRDYEADA